MKYITTVAHFKWMFEFWWNVGVSPLKLHEQSEVQKTGGNNEKTSSEKPITLAVSKSATKDQKLYRVESWKSSSWKFWCTSIVCTLSLMFSLARLSYILRSQEYELSIRIASILLTVYAFGSFLITLFHFFKAKAICDFFWQWQSFEADFYKGAKCIQFLKHINDGKYWNFEGNEANLDKFMKYQNRSVVLYIILAPLSIILMGLNIAAMPRMPMYFYGLLVAKDREIVWLKYLCFFINLFMVQTFLICETQGEVFFIAMSKSIAGILKLLSYPTKIDNLPKIFSQTEIVELIDDSIHRYEGLQKLMKTFNKTFSWSIFIYKSFTIVRLCCYVYVLLKSTKKTDSEVAAYIVFPYAIVVISIKFILNITSFGGVRYESKLYLKSLMSVVLKMNPQVIYRSFERKLKSCHPLGFLSGNFYVIYPHTILTFYSVALTYQIIFLQL